MLPLALLLQRTDVFSGITEECIQREIIPHGHFQEYQKGQFLILPQQKVEQFGVVITGKVYILHIFSDGTQSLLNDIIPG